LDWIYARARLGKLIADNIHPYNWHCSVWGTGEIHTHNGTHEIDICDGTLVVGPSDIVKLFWRKSIPLRMMGVCGITKVTLNMVLINLLPDRHSRG